MTETNVDPRALHVAREVHMEHQPLAIILFGSPSQGRPRRVLLRHRPAGGHRGGDGGHDPRGGAGPDGIRAPDPGQPAVGHHENIRGRGAVHRHGLDDGHGGGGSVRRPPRAVPDSVWGQNPPPPRYAWSCYRWDLASARQELDHMILVLQHNGCAAGKRISGMLPAAVRQA